MAASTARWQLLAGEVRRQASGFLQDKYKQARLALGDVTPAELLVQEATNNDACVPDAKTLACIADAAFDMDDCWRIAKVLHQRLGCVDWKEWRPVYKALVVLEFLLTHGPEDLPREFAPDMPAINDLRSFNYIDDKGFNWGACMQRRTDSILTLLTDGEYLKEARRRAIRVSQEVQHGFGFGSPTSSSSPSSASSSSSRTSRTWSFGSHYSDSPTMCFTCASDADYRHDKKFDAYTADDDYWMMNNGKSGSKWPATVEEDHRHDEDDNSIATDQPPPAADDAWPDAHFDDSAAGSGSWSARLYTTMLGRLGSSSLNSRASGFQSLSHPERRTNKKLHRQLSSNY
ncbi:hypothetical protein ACP70R_018016 [Stipagrostis hirtigluma subsp. patula]